ncbi:MAG TPA: hypothetical protein VGM41_16680 [Chitinophagaceae bacterium]|jgi:hypothetical protein
MKKLTGILAFTCLLGIGSLSAQVKEDINKDATKVGNKTEHVVVKGKSAIVDHRFKGKVGPHNEPVYIDHNSKYYYVGQKGRKMYIKRSQCRNEKRH